MDTRTFHGPFEVLNCLYDCNHVLVFQTRLTEDGDDVAIKAIDLSVQESERSKQIKALDESLAPILALSHENVVRHLRGFCGDIVQGHVPYYYIVMEYCRGRNLHKEVSGNPVGGALLGAWINDILSGLAYLHKNKIVHRDLKGSNIVLSTTDRTTCCLKICDFGYMKRLMASITKPQEISYSHGTCAFMSPEIIDAGPKLGRKTDIWSFGCVVIEMITGRQPQFYQCVDGIKVRLDEGKGRFKILNHVTNGGRPELLDEWPVGVYNLVDRCLQREPDDRPSAQALLDANWPATISTDLPTKALTD